MDKMVFIYSLSDPLNGSVKWIGKTCDPQKRLSQHLKDKDKSIHINWISNLKSVGMRPILDVVDEVEESEWEFWEKHYISLYKSWGFQLLNKSTGGKGGCGVPMRPKTMQILKERAYTKEANEKRIATREAGTWRANILKRMTGELNPGKANRKPISQMDINGGLIMYWESPQYASKILGIDSKTISNNCKGKSKLYKGYKWEYKTNDDKIIVDLAVVDKIKINILKYNESAKNKSIVVQYTKDGSFVNEWRSINVAYDKTGIDKAGIYRACVGEYKSYKGFIWKYKSDMKNV